MTGAEGENHFLNQNLLKIAYHSFQCILPKEDACLLHVLSLFLLSIHSSKLIKLIVWRIGT